MSAKNEAVKILQKKRKEILEEWMKNQLKEQGLKDSLISDDEQHSVSAEILNAFIDGLNDVSVDDANSGSFEKLQDLLASVSITRARQGYSPRETGVFIFGLKEALITVLQKEMKDPAALFEASYRINRLLDSFGIMSFETFIKGREEVILRQTDEIAEISTPVIRVWDGILALPIIGTLDSSRTQVVMETLLQEIVESSSSIAIIDISGVPAVDSLVAQHLIKTVSATRLMGAECIISGIRPEIAQTVVHLGIDLSNITTKATMASALKAAFAMLQLEVYKKNKAAIKTV